MFVEHPRGISWVPTGLYRGADKSPLTHFNEWGGMYPSMGDYALGVDKGLGGVRNL